MPCRQQCECSCIPKDTCLRNVESSLAHSCMWLLCSKAFVYVQLPGELASKRHCHGILDVRS